MEVKLPDKIFEIKPGHKIYWRYLIMPFEGKRILNPAGHLYNPGEYYKDEDGIWRGQTPNGLNVCLKNHSVIEHDNGTISVLYERNYPYGPCDDNSILTSDGKIFWHGYIENGIWKEC